MKIAVKRERVIKPKRIVRKPHRAFDPVPDPLAGIPDTGSVQENAGAE